MGGAGERGLEVIRKFETGNDIRQIISCSEQGRALKLLKRREETRDRAEAAMKEIENETKKRKFSSINEKFSGNTQADFLEEEFKKQTVGLISMEEFKAKRKAIDDIIDSAASGRKDGKALRLKRKVQTNTLSFGDDEEADELAESESESEDEKKVPKKKHFGKNPSVNTAFLYDAERESELERKKQALIKEYHDDQDSSKKQKLEVTYSYWDGSGHRRSCVVEKGWQIGRFIEKCKAELEKTDFPELRVTTLDSLMYVKEDIILPHSMTFHELIKNKTRGRTGPLFNFDSSDDLQKTDGKIIQDQSHAGKIVDRKWFERNKHIFPASRWENYDKNKVYDDKSAIIGLDEPLRSSLKG